MKKLYIAGPMTGLPNYNREKFAEYTAWFRAKGHDVFNPGELDEGWEYEEYIRAGLFNLLTCDAVFFLAGWEESKGAQLEHQVATMLGLEINYERD